MIVEVCDLCEKKVSETNKTIVTIEDCKGVTFDFGGPFPNKRKFKGVICDECLNILKGKKINPPKGSNAPDA